MAEVKSQLILVELARAPAGQCFVIGSPPGPVHPRHVYGWVADRLAIPREEMELHLNGKPLPGHVDLQTVNGPGVAFTIAPAPGAIWHLPAVTIQLTIEDEKVTFVVEPGCFFHDIAQKAESKLHTRLRAERKGYDGWLPVVAQNHGEPIEEPGGVFVDAYRYIRDHPDAEYSLHCEVTHPPLLVQMIQASEPNEQAIWVIDLPDDLVHPPKIYEWYATMIELPKDEQRLRVRGTTDLLADDVDLRLLNGPGVIFEVVPTAEAVWHLPVITIEITVEGEKITFNVRPGRSIREIGFGVKCKMNTRILAAHAAGAEFIPVVMCDHGVVLDDAANAYRYVRDHPDGIYSLHAGVAPVPGEQNDEEGDDVEGDDGVAIIVGGRDDEPQQNP